MALKYWFPMTDGTIKNNGTNGDQFTSNAFSLQTNGKLGKCIKTLSTSSISGGTTAQDWVSARGVSFAGWFYFPESEIKSVVNASSSSYTNPTGTLIGYNSYGGAALTWIANKPYVNGGFGVYGTIRTSDGGLQTGGGSITSYLDKWVHLATTIDFVNKKIQFYINGSPINAGISCNAHNLTPQPIAMNASLVCGGNGPGLSIPYYCNDVRVYDEPISPREVAELAKGLVLHYPLNRGGAGRDNNIKASTIANRSCNNFVYNSTTNTWTMSAPVNSSSWGVGLYINDTSIKWKSGESWVVSMEVYVPKAMTWNHDINNKPDVSDTSPYTGNDYDDQRLYCSNGVMSSHSLQAGWNKIWFTQRAPSTYGLYNYSTNWGVITSNESAAIDIQIRNIKGEVTPVGAEVKPTSYIPNSSDAAYTTMGFNNAIEYDTSGFGNNGEAYSADSTGYFQCVSGSPRYSMATNVHSGTSTTNQKAGTAYIRGDVTLTTPSQLTIAFWAYIRNEGYGGGNQQGLFCTSNATGDSLGSDYQNSAMNHRDNAVNVNNAAGNSHLYLTSVTSGVNAWHHHAYTYDGQYARSYLDGVLQGTVNFSSAQNLATFSSVVLGFSKAGGVWRKNNNDYSDLRVYATALTADQVKQLYEAPISLANNGTLFANEFKET